MTDNYHHGNLRQALLDEAVRSVRSGEIESFSLRGCAKKLGVSPAAVYHHFSDKSSLMNTVIRETGLLLNARLVDASRQPASPGEHALALGLVYIDFAIDEPALFGQLMSTRCEEAEEVQAQSLDLVKEAILKDEADKSLSPQDLQEKVWASWAISHGFATLALAGRMTPDQAKSAFIKQCHPNS